MTTPPAEARPHSIAGQVVFVATPETGHDFLLYVPHTLTLGELSHYLANSGLDVDHVTMRRTVRVLVEDAHKETPDAPAWST